MLAYEFGADRLWCATCGEVLVEVNPDGPDRNLAPWEADHIVALEDGGAHEPDNFQVLCVPCHRMKTAAEAAARAGRRLPPDASQLALGEIAA